MDKYTKIVLTLIAFALWANLAVTLVPGRGLIRDANAQAIPQRVTIAGSDGPLEVTTPLRGGVAIPIYITSAPRGAGYSILPVAIEQIGATLLQQSSALPVDIAGIAGTPAKSSPGLPVAVAQTLAVTAKDPLPVTAKDPLPVTARDPLSVATPKAPLQVVVTKLPTPTPPASTAQPTGTTSTTP